MRSQVIATRTTVTILPGRAHRRYGSCVPSIISLLALISTPMSRPGRRVQVVQGPAAVVEGGEGVGEALLPVGVGGAGADRVFDGAGRAGAVADRADPLLVALVGVVPAL